jgi:hypothetical protein
MNFSLALTNLIIGASLANAKTTNPADLVRDRLEKNLHMNGMGAELDRERHLSMLHTDFSYFLGDWYNCLQTTLMTFQGESAPKHIIDQLACDGGLLGEVTKVGDGDQTLSFDIFLLNHCWFHDLGGEGQDPCPNDLLDSDPRGDGNVLVKYSFKGIGSFAHADRVEFHSDHTYLRDENGEWVPNLERAKIENMDTLVCEKYHNGLVCDWRINEYRTQTVLHENGCKKGNKCKDWTEKKCNKKGGEWSSECGTEELVPDGFVYDSFGSYYLVRNNAQCHVECSTGAPSSQDATPPPENVITGCYQGGQCGGAHGCCDCNMTEETCNGIWTDGCAPICIEPPAPVNVDGCYTGGGCEGSHGCCDCTMTEETCNGIWTGGCEAICLGGPPARSPVAKDDD